MTRGTIIKRPFLVLFSLLLVLACRAATVSYVTLTSSANPIRKGQSATLSCTTFYSDGAHSSCVSPVYTDDQSHTVVRVSGNTISGYSIGSATVKVTVSGVSATLAMKVIPPTQEALGVITATQVAKGLGFNVDPASDWEFQMAAAAGATHVRFQCGWATVELQTPPPQNTVTSNRYALQPYCQSAYTSSRNYSLHPIVIAGYGPPYHTILRV
ncbi:MAG: hypothetical protein QOH35_3780, partial [Acidobacteriaceae bacterium]|nr:hypothetical protein [Acidobacteriaceae bacterium]